MRNDNRIKKEINETQLLIDLWVAETEKEQTIYSDRILEKIIEKSKKITQMYEGRFEEIDFENMITINN